MEQYRLYAGFIDSDTLALGIPLLALMIPIIAVLASHQQKMARIIHGGGDFDLRAQVDAMRMEIEQLKSQVRDQAMALQQTSSQAPPVVARSPEDPLQNRVGF